MKSSGWWPLASLRSRLILLIVVSLLIGQALTLYIVVDHQRTALQATSVNLLVTSITTLKSAISLIEPSEQEAFVQQTSQGQWALLQERPPRGARFYPHRGDEADFLSDDHRHLRRSLRGLSRQINQALGATARVAATAEPQPYLYVSLGQAPGQGPWLRIPLDYIDPPVRVPVLLWWLGALTLLVLVALWFSWHITRPLTRLVQATDSLAQGRPQMVEPGGPVETRRLGQRFNAMLDALAQTRQTQQTMLAGLPHDLKGPMARMALRIEMSQDETLKAGLQRDLQEMRHIAKQFLDYLRNQDVTRLELERLRLDLWLQAEVADRRQIGQDVSLDAPVPNIEVKADRAALQRLLDNLIDNALTHGKPPVEIGLRTEGADTVCLSVSDHGQGILRDEYERVLRPFERADAARSRTGNVGLGLSLVKGIAIAHAGSVKLSAATRGGLVVEVRLPRADSQ